MKKENWVWQPHPGHLIVGDDCRFHLNTYVGGYIVSTVGEWWPDRQVREIHAKIFDPKWFKKNKNLKGDSFNYAYFKKFGFMEVGSNRTYETMVFKAEKSKEACCPWTASNWSEVDFDGYETAGKAFRGHLEMCKKYASKTKNA